MYTVLEPASETALDILLAGLGSKRIRDLRVRVPNRIERDDDPQTVEEDEVHPHVHEVATIKIDIAGEPLGAKSHES